MMIDTLTTARTLERRGFTKDQAEGLTEVIRAAVNENVATKSDLGEVKSELKADIASLRAEVKADIAELRAEFGGLRAEVKADIANLRTGFGTLRTEVKTEIANLKTEIANQKVWMFGAMIVVGGFAITIDKLFK